MKGAAGNRFRTAALIYAVIDVVCVALGMGVPILCILLGFVVGWFVVQELWRENGGADVQRLMRRAFNYGILSVSVTFAIMLLIWGRMFALLFQADTDYANFGIPLILYQPKWSFVGWLMLMIFISPCLQLLTTVFSAYVAIQRKMQKSDAS